MKIWKRMPAAFDRRQVMVTTRSYRRYWLHSLEKIHADLFGAIERWVGPGAVVWDVGANVGMFTLAAAVRAGATGKVYAFEADIEMAALIARSLLRPAGEEAPVCLCPAAIGDRDGEARFVISGYRTAASSLEGFGRFHTRPTDRLREVPMWRLDQLLKSFTPPTVLKVDVEGAENLVLEGAQELFRTVRPILLLEASGGASGERTCALLDSWGYLWRGWEEAEWGKGPVPPGGDMVAVPAEHPARTSAPAAAR